MAANNIYIQVDFNSQSAQQNVNALNQAIAQTGTTSEKSSAQSTKALQSVNVSVQQTSRSFSELTTALAGLGIARTVAGLIQVSSELSRAQQAMTAFAGSAEEANKVIEQVQIIAAQSPFRFKDLQETARQLLAFGFAAKDVPGILNSIKNQVAAMGGTMEDVNSIARLFGRIMEKDVVGAMDLMRKLPAEGFPIMKTLRDELSKSLNITATTEDVKNAIKEGLLNPLQTVRAITENMGKQQFNWLNDAAAAFKNLGDVAQRALGELFGPQGFGKQFAQLARDIEAILAPVAGFIKALEALPDPMKQFVVDAAAIAAAVVSAAGAISVLVGIFSPLIGLFQGLVAILPEVAAGLVAMLPELVAVAAALAGVGYAIYKLVPGVHKFVDDTTKQFSDFAAKGQEFAKALDAAIHPKPMDKGDIIDPNQQKELFDKLLGEVQQTADAGRRTLLEGLSSPAEAVLVKYTDLFAKLEEKIRLLKPEFQKQLKDALGAGETAELQAARFKEQKQQIDELAKYQIEKTKGSYELQIAYIEALDEQNLRKKIAGIDRIGELRAQSAAQVARIENDALQQTYNAQVELLEQHRDELKKLGIDVTDTETRLRADMEAKQKLNTEKAVDEGMKYRLDAWKKSNDALIEDQKRVYDAFKSEFDQIFNILTGKSKDIGKAMSDEMKKLLLGEARNIFSTLAAQGATAAAGYGVPEAPISRGGGILSMLFFRGTPPRKPGPPPDIFNPARGESGVHYDDDGKGGANRFMAATDAYSQATVVFAKAVEHFAGATVSTTGSADRMANSADSFSDAFEQASAKTGVSADLLRAVTRAESGFNPYAVSGKGAAGLMQLMPKTAAGLGVADVFNPQQNIQGGAKYLGQLLQQYGGDVPSALAAYNMGPGAFNRAMARGTPLPAETQAYVKRIMGFLQRPTQQASIATPPFVGGGGRSGGGGATGSWGGGAGVDLTPPAASPQFAPFAVPSQTSDLMARIGTPSIAAPVSDWDMIQNLPTESRTGLQTLAMQAPQAKTSFWQKAMGMFGGSPTGSGGGNTILGNVGGWFGGTPVQGEGSMFKQLSTGPFAGTPAGGAAAGVGMMLATAGIFGENRGTAAGVAEAAGGGFLVAGPIGAAVGFGIGMGEVIAGVESPRRKAVRLAATLYHININNTTADAIVSLANSQFGGNIGVAMRSPQVRQMLGVYAAGTGQAGSFNAGSSTPHGATLVEQGGSLYQAPTYEYGNAYSYASNLPIYGGQPTHVLGAPGGGMQLSLNIAGQDAAKFLQGNVVSPDVVQTQYAASMQNSNGRVAQALMMSEPGSIVG